MAEEKRCTQCGATLAADAPQGLCPACLLKRGLESGSAPGQATPPATPAELAGQFPELEILELIGRGGMGAVYKARQKQLDRLVALKVLPASVKRDPAFAERFARESRALAKLTHPNIVTVHDSGQTDGLFYFVMEFVDGMNLRQLLNTGNIAPNEALAIVPQICDALQYAHDKGIVHRDIKPENILLVKDGTVKIADFGLAKLVGLEAKDLTMTGRGDVMGTPHYMAPEQVEHPQDVDHRADIYSLGVVFYQMLTGELPIGRFAPPSRKVQIDVRLDEVVLRALEKEPERRYQQASQFKTGVETIMTTAAPVAAAGWTAGAEYKSKRTLWGLPLLHVATGFDPSTGRPRVAKGIIAIGDIARGVVAVGGMAFGGIAFGGLAVGGVAFGGGALGLVSLGGLAVALVMAVGGLAVGTIALGGCAVGYYAYGGAAFGAHPFGVGTGLADSPARGFFEPWAPSFIRRLNRFVFIFVVLAACISMWLRRQQIAPPVRRTRSQNWWTDLNPFARLVILATLVVLIWFLEMRFVIPWADRWKARGGFPVFVFGLHVLLALVMGWWLAVEVRKLRRTAPETHPFLRRRWLIGFLTVMTCFWTVSVVVDVGGWWNKRRSELPLGVWVPAQLDDSIAAKFAPLPLWVTGVSQHKQVVLIDIVCEYRLPPPYLGLQFSGPLVAYPAALTSEVAGVDYFIEPGRYLKLPGPPCSAGKTTYRLGFILSDETTAAMAVEQVRRSHMGKPRGLTLERDSLTLFELKRNAGRDASNRPVRETMLALLHWPPPNIEAVFKGVPVGHLAFVTSPPATIPGEIEIISKQGAQPPKRIEGNTPAFMPDGKRLLYCRQEPKRGIAETRYGIYVYDFASQTSTPLLNDPDGNCLQPSASPDGKKLTYVLSSKNPKPSQIWVANADGSGRKPLTEGDHSNWTPRWSPDGQRIVFESTRDANREIYVMDSNGQNQTNLTQDPTVDHSPSWSPDGSQIAYMSRSEGGTVSIFVMNADGSNKRNLSKGTTRDSEPVWSPDGRWIAFTRNTTNPSCPETMDIWIMKSDGTEQQRVTQNEPAVWSVNPTWGR